jgi:hypothetical protein
MEIYAYAILAHIMNVLRSLRHRPFALLWSGQTISRLGGSFYRGVLALTGLAHPAIRSLD